MSRWHPESCLAPVIVVEQQMPICKSCNATPNLNKIISQQADERLSPSAIPPDEARGKLNLWWPPCVPYASSSCPATLTDDPAGGHYMWWPLCLPGRFKSPFSLLSRPMLSFFSDIRFELQNVLVRALVDVFVGTCHSRHHDFRHPVYPSHQSLHHDFRSPVYPFQLKCNDLRLIRLTPVEDVDAPVHVDLEVHNGERYPDYETVSYTWGGEVCDSTICRPVYVGRHWDVLIQTHNCWEMLRYLRPRRDTRTIWIDAICINQYDFQERETHVGNMGRIYENAIRTIAYLGPDLVSPTSSSSPHPWRHYLQYLDFLSEEYDPMLPETRFRCTKSVTLAALLKREYFQRVWVIQELLLSRDVVFGIGNMEFTINHRLCLPPGSNTRRIMPLSLKSDQVPWFERITQGKVFDGERNALISGVDLASESKSSDPRDKIFGVLGMIETTTPLTPSYSISFRHLAIGYFAYCLIEKKDMRVLANAAGLRASANMPSWTPPAYRVDTKAPTIPRLGVDKGLSMRDSNGFSVAYKRSHSSGTSETSETSEASVAPETPEASESVPVFGYKAIRAYERVHALLEGRTKLEGWQPKDHSQTCWTLECRQRLPWNPEPKEVLPDFTNESNRADPRQHWHSHIKVDTLTGALLDLSAIHVLCFDQAEMSLAETYYDEGVYTYVFKNGWGSLYVYSQDTCFELPTDASKTHLFALCEYLGSETQATDPVSSQLCILRSCANQRTFQLVSANVYVCLHTQNFPTKSHDYSKALIWDEVGIKKKSLAHMRHAHDDKSPKVIRFPTMRLGVVSQLLGARDAQDQDGHLHGNGRRRILPVKDLHRTLSSVIRELRRPWNSQDNLSPENLRFLNFNGQLCPPNWISLAFPGVTNPINYLQVLHAAFLVESGVEGSAKSFLELYLDLIRDFKPRVLQGLPSAIKEIRTKIGSETMVELCFEHHQYSILQQVLDLAGKARPAELGFPTFDKNEVVKPKFIAVYTDERSKPLVGRPRYPYTRAMRDMFMYSHRVFFEDDFNDSRWEQKGKITLEEICSMASYMLSDGGHFRIAFDLKLLMTWAQLHPCTRAFRGLTQHCRNGENELTLFLRDPQPEDADLMVPWLSDVVDHCFGINKSARLRQIAVI